MKHDDQVCCVAFSPDGTRIATAARDVAARLWNATTGKPLGQPMKHDYQVCCVAFSPDGTKIATASDDKTARLWDATTGKPLGQPMKHDDQVCCVAYSPDGTRIATAAGLTARLWDVATGRPLGQPMKHDCYVGCMAFSADGTRITTGSGYSVTGGEARLWPVPPALPDDPHWIEAYIAFRSLMKPDDNGVLRPATEEEIAAAASTVCGAHESQQYFDNIATIRSQQVGTYHAMEARKSESYGSWFAAAFHLRWLAKLEPKNTEWQQRLAKAEKNIVIPANNAAEPPKAAVKETGATNTQETSKPEDPKSDKGQPP